MNTKKSTKNELLIIFDSKHRFSVSNKTLIMNGFKNFFRLQDYLPCFDAIVVLSVFSMLTRQKTLQITSN